MTEARATTRAIERARETGEVYFVIREEGEHHICEESMVECYFPGVRPGAIPAVVYPTGEIE